jgi:L-Lysine epsilon oxidase N-terminal
MQEVDLSAIAYGRIFPPVNIARLGDNSTDYLISPEFALHSAEVKFRDSEGKIKRKRRVSEFTAST